MSKLVKYLRYSGIRVTIDFNPCYWYWMPKVYKDSNKEWPDCMLHSWRARWLFLNINIWIDDGSW
jgi:hypothetical protein